MPLLRLQDTLQAKKDIDEGKGSMSYEAVIKVNKEPDVILKCFEPEQKSIKHRSQYTIKRNKNSIEFSIKAKDAVALKAATNSIIKMLEVIEKV